VKEGYLTANGLSFHYLADGPQDGPLALLLHGFPEFSYSWRHQLPALAARGLHAVAPDLRGYHLSDKPGGVAAYDIDLLADDVVGWMDALGAPRAHVIGHDWGGAVAWHVAMEHPDRVARLAVLDCPHPALMAHALVRNRAQRRKSWYMFFFQIPFVPERRLAGQGMRGWIAGWGGRLAESDLERYVEAFPDAAALTGPINYYRAAFRRWPRMIRHKPRKVTAPTLQIWGADDRILGQELLTGLGRLVTGPLRIEIVGGAGHFVQQDAPAEVNRLLTGFLC
jgi:epoxide hydrolase 4